MIYRKEFFDLQWHFATRVAVLARTPLADALLDYTNFYARFGLGRDFDQAHPTWREYLHGLQRSSEPREWTYEFYRSLLPDRGAPDIVASVGCFSYARLADGNIRLHFHNAEMPGISPLSAERQPQRRDELRQLFESVRRDEGETARVIGRSWLYHLVAYRRIFPITYLATATPGAPSFRGMPLWGQFLDRQGAIRRQTADLLLRRLSTQTSTLALGECFPYQVLALDGTASFFT